MKTKTTIEKPSLLEKVGYGYLEWTKTILTLILLFQFSIVFSQNANELFVEGNKLYKQEKYNQAIEKYLQATKTDKVSPELYYNLANAYYKTNKVAPSIYYYEKALHLKPNDKAIKANLDMAKQMTLDNIEPMPKTIWQKLSMATIQKLHYNTWSYIAIGFVFIFALLFLRYHFSSETATKRVLFITSILSAIFTLLSVWFAFQTYKIDKNNKYAIVFTPETTVKNAPMLSAEKVFDLHEGTKVKVLKSKDNWKKIKIADGQTGWIVSDELKEL
jgi:tetratricopeptide (TPR) repeat protein